MTTTLPGPRVGDDSGAGLVEPRDQHVMADREPGGSKIQLHDDRSSGRNLCLQIRHRPVNQLRIQPTVGGRPP